MIDAMKQAMELIDAWERGANADDYFVEIATLRQAIEQAAKPKLQLDAIERAHFHGKKQGIAESEAVKRLWVGLTDEEIIDAFDPFLGNIEKGRAIEAKLRERNT